MLASNGTGLYEPAAATEGHTIVLPRVWTPDGSVRGCVYCPGRGGTYLEPFNPDYRPISEAFADRGIPVIVADLGDRTEWGNDTHIDRIQAAIDFLRDRVGCHETELVLYGGSMGSLGALNYANANQSAVKAVALALPVANLDDIHDRDLEGFATEIESAYTDLATYDAALPTHNPIEYASSFNVRVKAWASENDPIADWDQAVAWADAAPNVELVGVGDEDHGVGDLSPTVYADFLQQWAVN